MSHLLAVDLGGTKTLLQLLTADGAVQVETRYENSAFADFDAVLQAFRAAHLTPDMQVKTACIAVAGVIQGRKATLTNLPWQLDADVLEQQFGIGRVLLINDFAAVGEGIAVLTAAQLIVLQAGEPDLQAPRAVIGAGTGLGQAFMTPSADGWQVWSTEGGHTDFAPTSALEQRLLSQLFERWPHVSYERLISGMGLVTLYEFFSQQAGQSAAFAADDDAAAWISAHASQADPVALQALQQFVSLYGAQAGNLALTIMPKGGLYIAGGIALKNRQYFESGLFMQTFLAKGRMSDLLTKIPVYLINDPLVGVRGAAHVAMKAL